MVENVEYIKTYDCTLTGSRNAITPLILWSAIQQNNFEDFAKIAQSCLKVADYALENMQKNGVKAWKNENSPIVIFPRPSDSILHKWALAPYQDFAHIVTLSHVCRKTIDLLVEDLAKD